MVGSSGTRLHAARRADREHAQPSGARLGQRKHRVYHAVVEAPAGEVVDAVVRGPVGNLDGLDPGRPPVEFAHDLA
jgi:hypothetical protein